MKHEMRSENFPLLAHAPRPADVRVAPLVKTESPLDVACKANARADTDRAGGLHRGAQPEFAGRAQVHPIVPLIDLECGSEPSGAASQIAQIIGVTLALHRGGVALALRRGDFAMALHCGGVAIALH